MPQRDAVRRAALGRHVRRVDDGELEDAAQAGVAHAVAAFELGGLVAGDVVRETGEAFDAGSVSGVLGMGAGRTTHSFTGSSSLSAGVNMPRKLGHFSFFASGAGAEDSYTLRGRCEALVVRLFFRVGRRSERTLLVDSVLRHASQRLIEALDVDAVPSQEV